MVEKIEIGEYLKTKITYDPESHQFCALVGGRELRRAKQTELEKEIREVTTPGRKVVSFDEFDHEDPIEVFNLIGKGIGSKVKIVNSDGRVEDRSGYDTYEYDEALVAEYMEVQGKRAALKERLEEIFSKFKQIEEVSE